MNLLNILTFYLKKQEWLITEEDGVEKSTKVLKRSCCIKVPGESCNQEIWEKTVAKSGEDPITTINTTMSNEELEQFEICWLEKWTMDKQGLIGLTLKDITPIDQMKNGEAEEL